MLGKHRRRTGPQHQAGRQAENRGSRVACRFASSMHPCLLEAHSQASFPTVQQSMGAIVSTPTLLCSSPHHPPTMPPLTSSSASRNLSSAHLPEAHLNVYINSCLVKALTLHPLPLNIFTSSSLCSGGRRDHPFSSFPVPLVPLASPAQVLLPDL